MRTSDSIKHIGAALGRLQRALQPAKLDGLNQNFDSRYPSLASVWNAARPQLQKQKLTVTQSDGQYDALARTVTVETLIIHAGSGEFIEHTASCPTLQTADSATADATKLKRRALASALGIVAEDEHDTDGVRAHLSWGEAWDEECSRRIVEFGPDAWQVECALRPLGAAQRLVLLRRGLSSDALIEAAKQIAGAL